MSALSPAFQLLLLIFAGWVDRQQLEVIEYLQKEIRLLKERSVDRPIHFTMRSDVGLRARPKCSGGRLLVNWKPWLTLTR